MSIPLRRGRSFTAADTSNTPLVMLINETTAKRIWPHEDPLGKRVRLGGPDDPLRTIVGIVGDVRHVGLDEAPDLQFYVPHAQWTDSFMQLVVRTAQDPKTLTGPVRETIRALDPDLPVDQIATMSQLVSTSTAARRFTLVLVGIFAAGRALDGGHRHLWCHVILSHATHPRNRPPCGARRAAA